MPSHSGRRTENLMAGKNYVRISYTGPNGVVSKVRLPLGSDDPMKYRMFQLAEYGISLLRARVAKALDVSDSPMPPLSGKRSAVKDIRGKFIRQRAGYAEWKQKNLGSGVRDLYGPGSRTFMRANGSPGKQKSGTGHMLDDIHTTQADERRATITITTQNSRQKAAGNERTLRRKGSMGWWGWSPRNVSALVEASRSIVDERITSFQLGFRGIPAKINKAIPPWRDGTARTFGNRMAA
jgi:hypothetical protein